MAFHAHVDHNIAVMFVVVSHVEKEDSAAGGLARFQTHELNDLAEVFVRGPVIRGVAVSQRIV